MNTDLYSLPKDIFVKLVSTIREDTIKDILDLIRKQSLWTSLEKCSFDGCHRFFFFNEDNNYYGKDVEYYNDGRVTFCCCLCDGCECDKNADKGVGWLCREHVPENYIIINNEKFNFVCHKCVLEGHYKEQFEDN